MQHAATDSASSASMFTGNLSASIPLSLSDFPDQYKILQAMALSQRQLGFCDLIETRYGRQVGTRGCVRHWVSFS
jgi:hypothetical protein